MSEEKTKTLVKAQAQTQAPAAKLPSRIEVLKAACAPDATPAEFAYFLEVCRASKLNPFKREIWFIKTRGYTNRRGETVPPRVQVMTGINGFLAIANSHPAYDGMEHGITRDENGALVSAWCKVYRKDRKYPGYAEVYLKEFKGSGLWDKMETALLLKCAKSHALRESFSQELGGLLIEEEMKDAAPPKISFEDAARLTASKEPLKDEEVTALVHNNESLTPEEIAQICADELAEALAEQ